MSANIVEKELIDALITWGLYRVEYKPLRWYWPEIESDAAHEPGVAIPLASVALAQETRNELTLETAERVGQFLVNENYESVNHRYDEKEPTEDYQYSQFPLVKHEITPANLLGLIHNLEYQSCEHPGWKKSEAKKFLSALKSAAICKLDGYNWSLPEN